MIVPSITKSVDVPISEQCMAISSAFDFALDGHFEFQTPEFKIPDEWGVGLIVGPSGSGKTTILENFGKPPENKWDKVLPIFDHFKTADIAMDCLMASGLNSIPQWTVPYRCLSEGQKARADIAIGLKDGAVFDEYSSSVNRAVAKSMSAAIRRTVDAKGFKNIVLATCHDDVEEWLQPDWVIDTYAGHVRPRRCHRRPEITLDFLPCSSEAWAVFSHHHYLSGDLNKSSRCWIAVWDGELVGFASTLAFPNGHFKNGWREHRVVVLPDYQGLGFGMRISDAVGEMTIEAGGRYFSKTAHPRMISYRERSAAWKGTSKNMKARPDYMPHLKTKEDGHKAMHVKRVCGSHEYIGYDKKERD